MVAADYNDLSSNQPVSSGQIFLSTEDIIKSTDAPCEPGHSRNSSNTSQLSKASGYSSIHSHTHSRQSSSGDSGHIRYIYIYKELFYIRNWFIERSENCIKKYM